MLGFLTSTILAQSHSEQQPASNIQGLTTGTKTNTDEVQSPNDWVKENQIKVYNSQVVLNIANAQWATFTDTHSMEPVLSSRANAIEIVPNCPGDIKIGDIVSYSSAYADGIIIHRVVAIDSDAQGTYFTMKGDNNKEDDPGRIRCSQVKRVVVGIIY